MRIKVVLPVFNDWQALRLLIDRVLNFYQDSDLQLSFLVVNDCSSIPFEKKDFEGVNMKVLHLVSNNGHQRAIALGLSYLVDYAETFDAVVVMDSDGEDRPEDIVELIKKSKEEKHKIIFAQRKKRAESYLFRLFYFFYKIIFKSFTGHLISFGNFSLIPKTQLKKLTHVSEIWNNYPGGVIRSKLPYSGVPLDRGARLAGQSKMNFTSLILHGMSAVSVFFDFAAVRILFFVALMAIFSILGSLVVLYLKLIEHQATPGWASNLLIAFMIIFLLGFIITLFILFMNLNTRRYNSFVPYIGYKKYIDFVEIVND